MIETSSDIRGQVQAEEDGGPDRLGLLEKGVKQSFYLPVNQTVTPRSSLPSFSTLSSLIPNVLAASLCYSWMRPNVV